MIKYSFIVPVYNTSKYLKKCITSLINQTYKNYEIIVVNDGSTDDSLNILNEYISNKKVKIITQENQGLSVARNNGVNKAKGKYLLFVDSDDYVKEDLLENIDNNIEDVDLLRFQIITEFEDGNIKEYREKGFDVCNGKEAFEYISSYHFVEPAWCYVYKTEFYLKNKFSFKENVYHEDYGLIPYIIYKARKVKSISYLGYYYLQREGSIINSNNYEKTVKKAFDMLKQYNILRNYSKNKNIKNNTNDYYLSFISNSVIIKARELKRKERKIYVKKLKESNAFNGVLVNNFLRKLKKLIMKINFDLYLRVVK